MTAAAVKLGDIVAELGGELIGSPELSIERIGPLETADAGTIAFLSNPKYRQQLVASQAGCVIVASSLRDEVAGRPAAILTDDPYYYFARLTQLWARRAK